MKTANIAISDAATSRNRALMARAALCGLLLAAAGASHAEAGKRVCGIVAQDRNDARWSVGFVMKVNKEEMLGMLAALLQFNGWPGFLAVLAVYGVGQLLENYVLVPFLVGDRIGLHPLAVIFALLAFGQLFGFAGVLMALPVSAALLVGLRHLRRAYVASPVYQDEPD